MEMKDDNKANILDLLRTPNMRKKTLAMCFNWFACGLCFYGLTQYVSNLGGDLFVNVAVSGNHRNSSVHLQCYSKTLGKRGITFVFTILRHISKVFWAHSVTTQRIIFLFLYSYIPLSSV